MHLNTVRALFSTLLMAPLLPVTEWPILPAYYLVVIVGAAISVVCMVTQYNLAAQKNGRIACMYQPIEIILVFAFWLMIDPIQRQYLSDNPLKALGIGAGFLIFIASMKFVRKNDVGWLAFLAVVPIAVLYALDRIITKLALEEGVSMLAISLNFVFLSNIFMFIMSLPLLYNISAVKLVPSKAVLNGAAWIALFHTLAWVLVCIATILTPNPSYVAVIVGLAPVWFYIYYRLRRIPDDANPVAGIFMMLASFIVLLFSQ